MLSPDAKYPFESPTEVDIEDGVDDRVQEAVDVAEPDEHGEDPVVDAAHGGRLEQVVPDADGIQDVDREETGPNRRGTQLQDNNTILQVNFVRDGGRDRIAAEGGT